MQIDIQDKKRFYTKLMQFRQVKLGGKTTLPLGSILEVFKECFQSEYHQNVPNWRFLADILLDLERDGLILLPRDKISGWDSSSKVLLPNKIRIIQIKPQKIKNPSQSFSWHPQMIWAVNLKLKQKTFENLVKLNEYLRNRPDKVLPLPVKERSIQIFGDEKLLDALAQTFLKYCDLIELTDSYFTSEPLLGQKFPDATSIRVLILENRDTYASFSKVNSSFSCPIYQAIYYGQGLNILKSVLSLPYEVDPTFKIEYFGDLDPIGLYIPQKAQETLKKYHPEYHISMAALYFEQLIFLHHKNNYIFKDQFSKKYDYNLDFLTASSQKYVEDLFKKGERIPQELFNLEEIHRFLSSKSILEELVKK